MKQQLPLWSVIGIIAAALVVVTLFLVKGGSGEASKDELVKIRQNQKSFSSGPPPDAGLGSARGNQRSAMDGAPPGVVGNNTR